MKKNQHTIPKGQHTIPRCYLQNFTDNNGFVWVLDTKDKIFNVKPKNILVENDFYTITLKNGEKSFVVEDTLANIEGAYIDIFNNKISIDKFLVGEERVKASIFFAATMLRTRPYREDIKKMLQDLKKWMEHWDEKPKMNSQTKGITLSDLEDGLNNFENQHSISIVSNLSKIAQIIFDMKWAVFKNKTCRFVTSDDPIVIMRPASIKKYGLNSLGSSPGLKYKDAELTFPLSKDRLLLAGHVLERDFYLPSEDVWTDDFNHRTITHSSERIISDSKEKLIAIRDKYTETIYKQGNKKV